MTRGHRGSLLLRCRAFSSLSSRRFIPAHPTFTETVATVSVPSYTQAASSQAAPRSLGPDLPLPNADRQQERRVHRLERSPAPQHGPSTRFGRLLTTHGASPTGSVSLHPSVSASGHGPSGGAGPPLRCRGCSQASPPTRGSACLRLQPATAMTKRRASSPHGFSAPRGAQPSSSMARSAEFRCVLAAEARWPGPGGRDGVYRCRPAGAAGPPRARLA